MVINFGAGPSKFPQEVLLEVQQELLEYDGTGLSSMEISHRSSKYSAIHNEALQLIRDTLWVVRLVTIAIDGDYIIYKKKIVSIWG